MVQKLLVQIHLHFQKYGGDKIPYFNPENIEEMAEVITKELQREDTEEEKQKRIEWAKRFNWEKTSEEVKGIFASCKKQRKIRR